MAGNDITNTSTNGNIANTAANGMISNNAKYLTNTASENITNKAEMVISATLLPMAQSVMKRRPFQTKLMKR